MTSSTLESWVMYIDCRLCVQVLCRHTSIGTFMSDAHISSQTTPRASRTIWVKWVKWGKGILTLFAHAVQDAAALVQNRCTKYTCQGENEIVTLLARAMQGAAEMVLDRCTRYIETDGSTVQLNDEKKKELEDMISSMADKGLRTLCLSYRDYQAHSDNELPEESPDVDLTACCVVGIKVCGVFVRMPLLLEEHSRTDCSGLSTIAPRHVIQILQRQQYTQTSVDSATEWAFICTF